MTKYRLISTQISLLTAEGGVRLCMWAHLTKTAVYYVITVAGTLLIGLMYFRRPRGNLIEYIKEAAAAFPRLRELRKSAPRVDNPSLGLLERGYASLGRLASIGKKTEGMLLGDGRVIRLQRKIVSIHFEKLLDIIPKREELDILSRFAGILWLHRSLLAAAGILYTSPGNREARYRLSVAYPTFIRLLELRLRCTELDEKKVSLLFPDSLTAERLLLSRQHILLRDRLLRLSLQSRVEAALLRLYFRAHSLLADPGLRRQYDNQRVCKKLEYIHFFHRGGRYNE